MDHKHKASNAQKKGAAELLVLAQLEPGPKHGYGISQGIEKKSAGIVSFKVASLYPILYGLEERGHIDGRWVEKAGQRRRRYYQLTPSGRRLLQRERDHWKTFFLAVVEAGGLEHA